MVFYGGENLYIYIGQNLKKCGCVFDGVVSESFVGFPQSLEHDIVNQTYITYRFKMLPVIGSEHLCVWEAKRRGLIKFCWNMFEQSQPIVSQAHLQEFQCNTS